MVAQILVVRLKAIGDVMFTRPALAALRTAFPKARITFVTGAITAPLVRVFSEVDEVLVLDRRAVGWNRPLQTVRTAVRMWSALHRGKFDLAIDLHGNAESALISGASGASQRWGWSVGSEYRKWYTTHVSVKTRPGTIHVDAEGGVLELHPADWHVEFLRRCGIAAQPTRTALKLPPDAVEKAGEFWKSGGLGTRDKVLFFQPFSSAVLKDWPLERQIIAGNHWKTRGFRIVFGGSPAETPRLQTVKEAGFLVAAGLDLLAMTALMARCSLSVGSDTGLIHLAHAAGARVLDLRCFKNAYPHQCPERAITAPDHGPVAAIPLKAVLEAMEDALAGIGLGA